MAAPWFKIYSKELLSDPKVKLLTHEQLGMLLILWAYANEDGCSIPADPNHLAKLLGGITGKQMVKHLVWVCQFFSPIEGDPSRLQSARLLSEQIAYEAKCQTLRENGNKGGRPPKPKAEPDGLPNEKPSGEPDKTEVGSGKLEKALPPTPKGVPGRKPRGQEQAPHLGEYPQELSQAVQAYRQLMSECRSSEILERFPADKQFLAAGLGAVEGVWKAWQKRLGSVVHGTPVGHADIQEAVQLLIETKREQAKRGHDAGGKLAVPMLPTLINSDLFVDALVRVKELAHAG